MSAEPAKGVVHAQNRGAYDRMVRGGRPLARPASDADFRDPLQTVDPLGWLGKSIRDRRVLCLAAGGGRQSALYAAAGGRVTVVDLSPAMLAQDREVAAERGLHVETVEASMDDLRVLAAATFDLVIHPVSTCYVPDVQSVYREVARVTAPRGLYISQHKSPTSLQTDLRPCADGYVLREPYHRRGPLPSAEPSRIREQGALEFLHRLEELIGGLCRAGFAIEDFVEPAHADPSAEPGTFGHRSHYVAPYLRVKARRTDDDGARREFEI